MDDDNTIQNWQNKHGYHFGESLSGIQNFEKFLIHLGYGSEDPRYIEDEPIKAFLIDNSGVFEKIIEFIEENLTEEQKQNLIDNGNLDTNPNDTEDNDEYPELDPELHN